MWLCVCVEGACSCVCVRVVVSSVVCGLCRGVWCVKCKCRAWVQCVAQCGAVVLLCVRDVCGWVRGCVFMRVGVCVGVCGVWVCVGVGVCVVVCCGVLW